MSNHPDNGPDIDAVLDRALSSAPSRPLRHRIEIHRHWRNDPDTLTLEPTYRAVAEATAFRIQVELGSHRLFLDQPVKLVTAEVGKPWGRELWLTGIEARGESGVETAGGVLPLSQYLALAPRRLTGGSAVVLLKILDPRPEPVAGELYFEAHEEKREVYVVTHVNARAWPDGRGAIRYGMNQDLRRRYDDDRAFRRDYLDAVKRYERVRRAIDAGQPVAEPEEADRRAAMEAFTHLRPLTAGDVVSVPTWLPHSLQHGVRVIEFQTPTYERYILSSAQQVLTQDHWDTEAAIDRIRLDVPDEPGFEAVAPAAERIVAFPDFTVWRVTLAPGDTFKVPGHPSYGLCTVARGRVRLDELTLAAEEAALVPAAALTDDRRDQRAVLRNAGDTEAVVLLAAPDL